MFPIMDVRGRVIAFGGRTLGDDTPKYLNSPETPIFSKGISLYGISFAKAAALKDPGNLRNGRLHGRVGGLPERGGDGRRDARDGAHGAATCAIYGGTRTGFTLYMTADFAGEKASDRGLDIFLEEEVDAAI